MTDAIFKPMEESFKQMKEAGTNNVDNIVKWMKDSKLVEDTKEAEEKVRKLFEDAPDKANVEFGKFKDVVTKMAEGHKSALEDLAKGLSEKGQEITKSLAAKRDELSKELANKGQEITKGLASQTTALSGALTAGATAGASAATAAFKDAFSKK